MKTQNDRRGVERSPRDTLEFILYNLPRIREETEVFLLYDFQVALDKLPATHKDTKRMYIFRLAEYFYDTMEKVKYEKPK